MTIDRIRDICNEAGNLFFDPGNMRWFSSRVHSAVYESSIGWFFVTSEASDSFEQPRRYSVRCFAFEDDRPVIDTWDWHKHDTRHGAHSAAREYAAMAHCLETSNA